MANNISTGACLGKYFCALQVTFGIARIIQMWPNKRAFTAAHKTTIEPNE